MPTIEEVGTDLELIQHLDFDTETSCISCERAAAWRWECRCCHTVGELCDHHHHYELTMMPFVDQPACKWCNTRFDPSRPEDLWIITPLGRHQ